MITVLDQRDDDWRSFGTAYLLIDNHGAVLAGNLESWPQVLTLQKGAWIEFDIDVTEKGLPVNHPVRAKITELNGDRLLVGTE